jgi:hypothetical protein
VEYAVKNDSGERWSGGVLRALGFYNPGGQKVLDPTYTVQVEQHISISWANSGEAKDLVIQDESKP